MLNQHFVKTEAGRAEIKVRALPLTRAARNLLLVIDGSKPASAWLTLVAGLTEADLQHLFEQGLIGLAAVAPPAAAAPVAAASTPAPAPAAPPAGGAQSREQKRLAAFGESPLMNYEQLYAWMLRDGAKQLGAMKRYMFSLELEQCQGLQELQDLALSLIDRVAQSKGEASAAELRAALGIRS